MENLKRQTGIYLGAAIMILIGGILLFLPAVKLLHITYFICTCALVAAVYFIVSYFMRDGFRKAGNNAFSIGVLLGIVSIIGFVKAESITASFPTLIAAFALVFGVVLLQDALDLQRAKSPVWILLLILAIAALLASTVVLLFYVTGEEAVAYLAFIEGIVVIVAELIVRLLVRKFEKKEAREEAAAKAPVIDVETKEAIPVKEEVVETVEEATSDGENEVSD